jgi:D-alanyl-D-alanine carboxypeptidase/D-alanyl-D-alanine-endopeptidase (penicillin-binding protein 4)
MMWFRSRSSSFLNLMRGDLRRRSVMFAALLALSSIASSAIPAPEPAPSASDAPAPAPKSGAIEQAIDKLESETRTWGGSIGVAIIEVDSGKTIAIRHEHTPKNPASNAKLFTAFAALKRLGPAHRYKTGLYGKLDGDRVPEIVLRGEGDPSLEAGHLWTMTRELLTAGVKRVGAILVDQSYFDEKFVPPAFDEQPHEWAPFRAPVSAVALDENTVTLSVRPNEKGKDATIRVDPPGFVDIVGTVKTTKKSDPEKLTLDLVQKGDRLEARVGGNVPEGSRVMRVRRRLDDPRLTPGHALRAVLESAGIVVEGGVKLGGAKEKRLLAAHKSEPLGALLGALGKDSDNFYAEMIFKTLAGGKKGQAASADAAANDVTDLLKDIGALDEGTVIKNGSGLFDANRVSAWSTAGLLRTAIRDSAIASDFTAQLATGGTDGTLRSRFKPWASKGAVRAKTGTLNSVASLSGYVLAPPGRSPLAFSILVTEIPGKVSAARPLIDKVVDAAAKQVWADR